MSSPSIQEEFLQAFRALINAKDGAEAKLIIEVHANNLLTDDADQMLEMLIRRSSGNANVSRMLEQHRAMLQRCRRQGIEDTFAGLAHPQNMDGDLNGILQSISRPARSLAEMPRRVELCRQALALVNRFHDPELWAALQQEISVNLAQNPQGDRAENLEQAIGHFQQVLKVRTREAFPKGWAATQYNLGKAYLDRIRGDRAENLEQAIGHFQQALKVRTREAFPEDWAATQHNLGIAYGDRIRGDRAENLEQAISHCQQALNVHTREALPEDWAATQYNLGKAYRDRIRGDHAENLEQAISHCQQALNVHTREALPEKWAMTLNDLGVAYLDRIRGDRAENLEQAINHFQQELNVRTREALPEKWAMTQHNLGIAYGDRIRGDRAENLEQAIGHFQQALEVITREAFPEYWAGIQNNLANAYRDRIRGDRAENLEQAIDHCQQAFEVRTREAFPEKWAMTQANLGIAYRDRIRGDRAENLEQAIDHYQQALEVRTREAFPAHHRQIQRNLGILFFEQHDWPQALTAFQTAIAAGEDLLASAYSEVGRQAEVAETAHLFADASYCLLQRRKYSEALVMLERSKTRLLAEALALADLDVISLPKQYSAPLQAARQTVRALEAKMRLRTDIPSTLDPEGPSPVAQLREKRVELANLIDTIRQVYPDFMPIGLDLPNILALIPPEGALAAPVFTPQGSAVFVIPHGATEVSQEHVIQLDDFKEDELHTLLRGSENEPGWLWAYQTYYTTHHIKNWQEAIASLTKHLWQTLIEPIHQRLSALSVKRVLLLPSGGLQLIPLHAAWSRDEDGQKRALLDDYEITYAPSAYALDIANRRATTRRTIAGTGHTALVVGVNDYKNLSQLVNAVPEAEVIARVIGAEPLLNAAATISATKSGAVGAAYLHLSCHGSFNWYNPMDSALYFAQDEPLRLPEIISELDLRSALLITLSACETGISDVSQSPDEYLGLPAAFLQAGAPAIISSLWTVDDRSTALLMERFYRNHIERGLTGPAALREAQLWLRDATRKELGDYYKTFIRMTAQVAFEAFMDISGAPDERPYADPFYWAAFAYNGSSI